MAWVGRVVLEVLEVDILWPAEGRATPTSSGRLGGNLGPACRKGVKEGTRKRKSLVQLEPHIQGLGAKKRTQRARKKERKQTSQTRDRGGGQGPHACTSRILEVQLWHLVKVARVVCGKKTKAERWPQQLKVNIPSALRLRQCEPDLVLTGLTRLLQIETDFIHERPSNISSLLLFDAFLHG